jgi:hypothetical protein
LRLGGARAALAAALVLATLLTVPAAGAAEPEGPAAAEVPALNAHWAFDEEAGTEAGDSSGNGWNAGLVNGPVWAAGLFGGAVSLDGNDDYLTIDSGLLNGVGDATVATWIKPAATGTHTVLSGANVDNSNEILLIIKSGTEIRFFSGEEARDYRVWTVPTLNDGDWHHLAFVRDAAGDSLELYLDGVSQGSQAAPVSAMTIEAGGLLIGQEQDSVGGGFNVDQALHGLLDDYYIYDRTLTAEEIAALAEPPADVTPPTAVGSFAASSNGLAVNLAWSGATDPESDIAAYRIYRDTVSGLEKQLLAEVPSGHRSYVDTATDPLTTYYYEISAVNGDELEGPLSPEVNSTTAETGGPGDPDVLGYWSFDDGEGALATDLSSHGNDGTVVGSAAWTTGPINGALTLDSSGNLVDVPRRAIDEQDTMTIALWTKLNRGGTHSLISAANNSNNNELLLIVKKPTLLRFFTGESASSRVDWSVPSINDGEWHHIAVVRDSGSDQVELFLDGQSRGAKSTPLNRIFVTRNGLVFGEEQDVVGGGFNPDQALDGSLDELWIYNRVLSVREIEELALYTPDETPPTAPTELVATANELSIALSWNAASDDDTGVAKYRVYRAMSVEGPWTKIATRGGGSTSYTDHNTLPNTKFYYFVKAVDGAGNVGEWSNVASATTAYASESLIAHWKLDEVEGTVAFDSSLYERNASLRGSPEWGTGVIGNGLNLNPATDYLKLRRSILNGADTLTVAMWMKADSAGTHALFSGANDGNSNEVLLLVKNDTEVRFFTGEQSKSNASWTVPTLTDGQWHHVAVIRDSVNDKVELFVDGKSFGKVAKDLLPLDIAAGGLLMGQEQDSVGGGFNVNQALDGCLDDVRIFDRPLSPLEIQALAFSVLAGK